MSANKVQVMVSGHNYTFVTDEKPEYIKQIADYVNKKITEIAYYNSAYTMQMATVMASVGISDELFKAKQSESELLKKVEELNVLVEKQNEEICRINFENEKFKKYIQDMENANKFKQTSML